MKSIPFGQVGYEAYCAQSGGKSLVSGATLPPWDQVKPEIQKAWEAASVAMLERAIQEPFEQMDKLAKNGWLVVLKRLPPERGWIVEGARSEYDAPCADQTVGVGLWLCELADMVMTPGHKYRNAVDGLGKTAAEAIAKAAENAERRKEHE